MKFRRPWGPPPVNMKRSPAALAILAGAVAVLPSPVRSEQPAPSPSNLTAPPVTSPITVDGALDEPTWQQAAIIADLTQQEPEPGAPTPWSC